MKTVLSPKEAYSAYVNRGFPPIGNANIIYNSKELSEQSIKYEELLDKVNDLDEKFRELAIKDGFTESMVN
jgi:hypothetical protein